MQLRSFEITERNLHASCASAKLQPFQNSGSLAEQYVHNNTGDKTSHRLMQHFPKHLTEGEEQEGTAHAGPRSHEKLPTEGIRRQCGAESNTSTGSNRQYSTYTRRACMHGRAVSGSRASVNARCSHISHRLRERQRETSRCPGCYAAMKQP